MTQGYGALPEFAPKPDSADIFLRLVAQNAAASIHDEPGYRRFDILVSNRVIAGMIRSRSVSHFALH